MEEQELILPGNLKIEEILKKPIHEVAS